MKKKIYVTLVLFLVVISYGYSQKENSNWFFGYNAGLTWTTTTSNNATGVYGTANATLTGMPTPVTGSLLSTPEGCFSISDVNGNLLFFSDGMTIWNRNKAVMTNGTGLTGNPSSAQSGIIFPYPYSPTKYIAVTLGQYNQNNLSYSVIDMSQSGELGAVDNTYKNILLTGQSGILGESVAAVRHTNRNDFWIVAIGRSTTAPSYLNVWKVTSAGVQAARHSVTIVNSTTTPTAPGGYIKFTSDGQHFVWVDFGNLFFAYGDFNPTTGIFSNVRIRTGALNTTVPNGLGYGVDFSASGKYLYLTYAPGSMNTSQVSGLHVYNFEALLATTTPNTVNPIKTVSNPLSLSDGVTDHFGSIQTGPDGRMYIPRFNSTGIFVIDNPENPTSLKIYKINGILPGRGAWGLPNFSAPWFRMVITPPSNSEGCAEVTATYRVEVLNGMGFNNVAKIVVNFGDSNTNSIVTYNNPTLGIYNESYKYKKPGTYTITVTAYNSGGGVELSTTSTMKINSCALRVNPHIRGINE